MSCSISSDAEAIAALVSSHHFSSAVRTWRNFPTVCHDDETRRTSGQEHARDAGGKKAALLSALGVSRFELFAYDVVSLSSHLSAVGILLGETALRILESLRYILHRIWIPLSIRPPHPRENPIPDANRSQFLLILRPSACVPPSMINAAISRAAIRRSRA